MKLTSPLTYPIALLLDLAVGTHTKSRFQNNDLKVLIEMHTHDALKKFNVIDDEEGAEERKHIREDIGLNEEQANLMISAIEMNQKLVFQKMIPIEKVVMFDYNTTIYDSKDLDSKGYSRVPIFEGSKNNIVGIFIIYSLFTPLF